VVQTESNQTNEQTNKQTLANTHDPPPGRAAQQHNQIKDYVETLKLRLEQKALIVIDPWTHGHHHTQATHGHIDTAGSSSSPSVLAEIKLFFRPPSQLFDTYGMGFGLRICWGNISTLFGNYIHTKTVKYVKKFNFLKLKQFFSLKIKLYSFF